MIPGPTVMTALSQVDVLALEIDPLDPAIARALAEPESPCSDASYAQACAAGEAGRPTGGCLRATRYRRENARLDANCRSRRDGCQIRRARAPFGSEILLAGMALGLKAVVSLESVALQMASLSDRDDTEAMLHIAATG